MHPAAGHAKGTLVNALIAHCGDSLSGIGGVKRPGIVHRLDKDTTGLMVVAKTDARPPRAQPASSPNKAARPARARLSRLRLGRARPPERHHRRPARPPPARPRQARGARRRPRGGDPLGRCWSAMPARRQAGREPARPARLETGRTHQIRVHLAHIGHPILGDDDLRHRLQDQGQPAGPRPAPRWKPLADRLCMLIYWPSNTPKAEKPLGSDRNCRAICVVYDHALAGKAR